MELKVPLSSSLEEVEAEEHHLREQRSAEEALEAVVEGPMPVVVVVEVGVEPARQLSFEEEAGAAEEVVVAELVEVAELVAA